MSGQLLFCIDYPPVEDHNPLRGEIAGWCFGPQYIVDIQAKLPGGLALMHYGVPRPDVFALYPESPNKESCGFSLMGTPDFLQSLSTLDLLITVRHETSLTKTYTASLPLKTNRIQNIPLRPVQSTAPAKPSSQDIENKLKQHLQHSPSLSLRLDIINKCNLRCIMCHCSTEKFQRQPTELFTSTEFKNMFMPLAPLIDNVMLSCAYEPLLSKYLPEILDFLAQKEPPLHLGLCSNATLLNAKIRRLLLEKGLTYVLFSMDGATKITLERIRRGAKFEQVVANILALRDLKKATQSPYPYITMDYVMMNSNLHETPAFVKLCSLMGVHSIDFRHLVPSEFFKLPQEELKKHPAKYNYYREVLLDEGKKLGVEVYLPKPFKTTRTWKPKSLPQVSLDDFERVKPDASDGMPVTLRSFPKTFSPAVDTRFAYDLFPGIACHHPFSEIMLTNKNVVYPCPYYGEPMGVIKPGQTLQDIFWGEAFRQARVNMFDPQGDPNCKKCPVKKKYFAFDNT